VNVTAYVVLSSSSSSFIVIVVVVAHMIQSSVFGLVCAANTPRSYFIDTRRRRLWRPGSPEIIWVHRNKIPSKDGPKLSVQRSVGATRLSGDPGVLLFLKCTRRFIWMAQRHIGSAAWSYRKEIIAADDPPIVAICRFIRMNEFIRLTEITQSVKQERRGTITVCTYRCPG